MSIWTKVKRIAQSVLTIAVMIIAGCGGVPNDPTVTNFVEAQKATLPTIERTYVNPIEVKYANNGSEVKMNFDLADSELDLNFSGRIAEVQTDESKFSMSELNRILVYYKLIQENIGAGNLKMAEFHTNEILRLAEIPEFLDLRGTLYYLQSDTTNAQKYWDRAQWVVDSINGLNNSPKQSN